MSTTTEDQDRLVDPRELESFGESQEQARRAIEFASSITEITDLDQSRRAAEALVHLKHFREDVEKRRKAEKAPYLQAGTDIDAAFNELKSLPNAAEEQLKSLLESYEAELERQRQEEIKREQRNAAARQKRAAEKGVARASAAPAPPPPPAPKGARAMSGGKVSPTTVTKYEIVDESQLPDEFCKRVPDKAKINAAVKAGLPIPGVRAWKEKSFQTRG